MSEDLIKIELTFEELIYLETLIDLNKLSPISPKVEELCKIKEKMYKQSLFQLHK